MAALNARLLLIGGGHAQIEVLRQLAVAPIDRSIMLVSPDRHTPYSGMLPGWIAGHYRFADCHIDLEPLARRANVTFVEDYVAHLDPNARVARLRDGRTVPFELASIDIGSVPPQVVPGAATAAWPVKPVGGLIARLATLAERIKAGTVRRIVAVGGGAAGVEVLLAIRHSLSQAVPDVRLDYAVVTDSAGVLPHHNARARDLFTRVYRQRGIAIHAGAAVTAVEAGAVLRDGAPPIPADVVIWATGAAAAPWVAASGLRCDPAGFMLVDGALRSLSHPAIFGAGDIATVAGAHYPKSGVYAVRQAPVLAANLRAILMAGALQTYTPQVHSLALISTGDRYAVAARGRWAIAGRWVWRWKDWIDRKFVARYADG